MFRSMPEECHEQIQILIKEFDLLGDELNATIKMIIDCARTKQLVSVFGEFDSPAI